MKTWLKRVLVFCIVSFLTLWGMVVVFGVYFTVRPRTATIEELDVLAGRPVESVTIETSDHVALSAWYVSEHAERAVILLAGIDSNRRACVERAAFYLEAGYSVLLPDLRASGQSGGRAVTLGWRERKDLIACYVYLRDRGYRHIGANGISLGAATICFALPELPDLAFVVLESSYDTLANAVRNRLAVVGAPHFIAYPYYLGLSLFTGTPAWRLRPLDYMAYCTMPALIMAGDAEIELSVSETQALYDACAAAHKTLYFFRGGRHEDFLRNYPEQYTEVLETFLNEIASYARKAA